MTNHAILIGDMDMDEQKVTEIFKEVWNDKPDQIPDGMKVMKDFIIEDSAAVAFIRIDAVRSDGLRVTRFLREKHPEVRLVWMASAKHYALSAFEEDVDAYLELPLSSDKLRAIGERFIRNEGMNP